MDKKRLLIVTAMMGVGSISSAAMAAPPPQCGSVDTQGDRYKINIRNESKDPIWYTVYKTQNRDGKSNWGCAMPGETKTHHPYGCGGGGYWVLGEQKKGNNCNGGNRSNPIYNVKLPANDRGLIIFKNNERGQPIWADTTKWN